MIGPKRRQLGLFVLSMMSVYSVHCTETTGGGGGQLKKSQKKSKSISGILGWVLTFLTQNFNSFQWFFTWITQ